MHVVADSHLPLLLPRKESQKPMAILFTPRSRHHLAMVFPRKMISNVLCIAVVSLIVGMEECLVQSFRSMHVLKPPLKLGHPNHIDNRKVIIVTCDSSVSSDDEIVSNMESPRPKKKSKFSQLMSGEKTKSTQLSDKDQHFSSSLFDSDPLSNEEIWSLLWRENGRIECLPNNAPNSNDPPSLYTCSLPDDNFEFTSKDTNNNSPLIECISPPELHNKREIHYIPSLLSSTQVESLLEVIKANIDSQSSSVHRNTKCLVAVEDGEKQYDPNKKLCITSILEPMIQKQILPVARSICKEPNLVVADSLVRWYITDHESTGNETIVSQSEALAPHYDVTSFATMIIPLNPEECEGGLYVQYGAGQDTRCTVDFKDKIRVATTSATTSIKQNVSHTQSEGHGMMQGDAILHRYDVMHGVQVQGGTRYSLVLWMAQDCESMKKTNVPWVSKDALQRKSVHAAFLHGCNLRDGLYDTKRDLLEAKLFWEWASERGHALSQYNLAMLLLKLGFRDDPEGPSVEKQKQVWNNRVLSLLEESANRGLDMSQHALGITYKQGYYGVKKDIAKARQLFANAARQGYVRSIEVLSDASTWTE